MTYNTGGNIQAVDYNSLAVVLGSLNEVYADLHSGATTIGAGADFGYGQSAMTSVSAGSNILISNWNLLFNAIRSCGTHQGTTVVPPLPVSNPNIGDNIAAYNTPTSLTSLISTLRSNRFNLAVGQTTLVAGSNMIQPGGTPWINSLTFTYTIDFGSWDYARYFFNSGGWVGLNGSMSPLSTPEDIQWNTMLTDMSPLKFNYNSTAPAVGTGGTSVGFYQLTTSYQTIYQKAYGSGVYTSSYIQVQARLTAAAGTNGQIQFTIAMVDQESGIKETKNGTTTYRVDNARASGAIVYPGPALIITNQGFISA